MQINSVILCQGAAKQTALYVLQTLYAKNVQPTIIFLKMIVFNNVPMLPIFVLPVLIKRIVILAILDIILKAIHKIKLLSVPLVLQVLQPVNLDVLDQV